MIVGKVNEDLRINHVLRNKNSKAVCVCVCVRYTCIYIYMYVLYIRVHIHTYICKFEPNLNQRLCCSHELIKCDLPLNIPHPFDINVATVIVKF